MITLVVVFDLDGTLFNHKNMVRAEWMGSKELWVEACKELQSFAAQYGVTINFAIATAKDRIDDISAAAAAGLHPFLFQKDTRTNEYQSIHVSPNGIVKKDSFIAYHETNKHLLIAEIHGIQTVIEHNEHIKSSFQIDIKDSTKINLMQNIAALFNVDDRSRVTLIDDTQEVLDAVSAEGFSVISCMHLSQEQHKKSRDQLAITFVKDLIERMKSKIRLMAPLSEISTDTDDGVVDGNRIQVTRLRSRSTTPAQIMAIEGIFNQAQDDTSLQKIPIFELGILDI